MGDASHASGAADGVDSRLNVYHVLWVAVHGGSGVVGAYNGPATVWGVPTLRSPTCTAAVMLASVCTVGLPYG